MSTMTETLNHEEALFIPTTDNNTADKEEYTPKTSGEYLGHITKLATEVVEFKEKDKKTFQLTGRTVKARFFNFTVCVAPETADLTFTRTGLNGTEHTHNGADYVGWEVRGGVPRFLEPNVGAGDTFDANPEGNNTYVRLCETLGIEIPTREIERDGKTLTVQVLPELREKDIIGLPVTAVVGRGKDWVNNDGETMPGYKVKFIKEWRDGKRLATDDLPF